MSIKKAEHPNVLYLSTCDYLGGAESIARQQLNYMLEHGYDAHMLTGWKKGNSPNISQTERSRWYTVLRKKYEGIQSSSSLAKGAKYALKILSDPVCALSSLSGREYFNYPKSDVLNYLRRFNYSVNLIHAHNLHSHWFDLRQLISLSKNLPVVVTLHDQWLFTGHCAHPMNCDRWEHDCDKCPNLTIPYRIGFDQTRKNILLKKNIYDRSRLYITSPSNWLLERAKKSILGQAIIEAKVIPNGIDTDMFCNDNGEAKRKLTTQLGLKRESFLIVSSANHIKNNPWKDYKTLIKAAKILDDHIGRAKYINPPTITLLLIGSTEPCIKLTHINIIHKPFCQDLYEVAKLYRAADLFWHAAHVDTFPTTIIESLTSGTPVIATAVGGIPEQIINGVTGWLVKHKDAEALALKTLDMITNTNQRIAMSLEARKYASKNFNQEHQNSFYLDFYQEVLQSYNKQAVPNCI